MRRVEELADITTDIGLVDDKAVIIEDVYDIDD